MRNKLLLLFFLAISYNVNSQSCNYAININDGQPADHPTYNWVNSTLITGCYNTTVKLIATGNMYCSTTNTPVYWYNVVPNASGSNYFSYTSEIAVPLLGQTIYMRKLQTSSSSQQSVQLSSSGNPANFKPTISGTTDLCNNITSSIYSGATNWSLTPSNAGTITTNANTCTITWASNYVGTVQLKGRTNATSTYCGYSPWSDDLNITLNSLPSTPTITQNGNSLQSSSTSGNQWYNQNGIINGETNQDYIPSVSGNYYVTVSSGGCTATSSNFNYAFLSTTSFDINKSIYIYPNPTTSNITIDLDTNSVEGSYHVKITNTLGQVIYNGKLNKQQSTIELKQYATSGLYIVSILDNFGTVLSTNKIILN